jgi:lipase maturation factor 1
MFKNYPHLTFGGSRWLFLRLLGVVYFVAFVSLAVQITGLVGERGILPVGEFLGQVHQRYGAFAYYNWPTLVWLSPSDAWLSSLCWLGAGASLLLIAGIAPTATAVLAWLLYLSLTVAGQEFLEFQWDSLLLETGLLAALYAPLSWRERLGGDGEPPVAVRWTIWLLATKLTFLSGITKLLSKDPTWANWTALSYHYETQPLPAWTSWFMYQLPPSVHYWSTGATLCVELAVPWLIWLPPRFWRVRLTACALMILLQVGIGATGNYGFFNLLTIVLYLSLLDDRTLGRLLPSRAVRDALEGKPRAGGPIGWRVGVNVVAVFAAVLSVMTLFREMDRTRQVRGPFDRGWPGTILTWVSPFNSVNGYGLFRVMTTARPEIVIEVSGNGTVWNEQEFKWKPGAVARRPQFVEPHMPRLDWQMWFAALDPSSAQDWLLRLTERMIAGDTAVTRLLGPNPLKNRPRYVRLAYYQYHFTSSSERARTGAWWKRDFVTYLTDPIEADRLPGAAPDHQ